MKIFKFLLNLTLGLVMAIISFFRLILSLLSFMYR